MGGAPVVKKPRGGRRRGAGRKPQGPKPKTGVLQMRISEELSRAIDSEVKLAAGNPSRSSVAADLLRWGIRAKQDSQVDDPTRDLCYLIAETALAVSTMGVPIGPPRATRWFGDPFTFQAFRLAVNHLLDALAPEGEVVSPVPVNPNVPRFIAESYATPEARARDAAAIVWKLATSTEPLPTAAEKWADELPHKGGWTMIRRHHRMALVRARLQRQPKGKS